MQTKNINKGSVIFVFYFIFGLALLAVAGYYIGINEQTRLFKEISTKKQQQLDDALINPVQPEYNSVESRLIQEKDIQIKSLIDSPVVVLKNISSQGGDNQGVNIDGQDVDLLRASSTESNTDVFWQVAQQAEYFVKINSNKTGLKIKLKNGVATGDNCYSSPTGKVCLPKYGLEKIWSKGDLNNDKIDDIIVSILSLERIASEDIVNRSFFAIIFSSSTDATKYSVAPFNYGVYSPFISSFEIADNIITAIGKFYSATDTLGVPSVNKVIKYKVATTTTFTTTPTSESTQAYKSVITSTSTLLSSSTIEYIIQKYSEAKLFSEQGDKVASWLMNNYTFSGMDISFRAPETWQKEEVFGDQLIITLKNPDGRNLYLTGRTIMETCLEYEFNLSENKNEKIINSEYIDLGLFGSGFYIKHSKKLETGSTGYYADICVNNKDNDRVIFGLFSSSKEDGDPYFVMFDKIWSTFKINVDFNK